MTKWEYRIVRTTREGIIGLGKLAVDKDQELDGETLDSALNILGKQGWELTQSARPQGIPAAFPWFVFKRPLG